MSSVEKMAMYRHHAMNHAAGRGEESECASVKREGTAHMNHVIRYNRSYVDGRVQRFEIFIGPCQARDSGVCRSAHSNNPLYFVHRRTAQDHQHGQNKSITWHVHMVVYVPGQATFRFGAACGQGSLFLPVPNSSDDR